MRVLVWQWGRRGAGPRVAVELAQALDGLPDNEVFLSLSRQAEILQGAAPPSCDLPVDTYDSLQGYVRRLLGAPFTLPALTRRVSALRLDLAICAMPGPLDLLMASALRRARVPFVVVVHDADAHPGDGLPFQMTLQRSLIRRAAGLVALTRHVAERLREQKAAGVPGSGRPLFLATLPPFAFGQVPAPPGAHGGPMRLLSFGRLLPYKGLDLLAEALELIGHAARFEMRVVGSGPESETLARLRALPTVRVENRWVPENEVGDLLAWSDAIVLSHREASQSGVAAAAIAARRWLLSTRVGGLGEQLQNEELAILCEPDAPSLAAALLQLLASPPTLDATSVRDPRQDWRETAMKLLKEIEATILGPRGGQIRT